MPPDDSQPAAGNTLPDADGLGGKGEQRLTRLLRSPLGMTVLVGLGVALRVWAFVRRVPGSRVGPVPYGVVQLVKPIPVH